MLECLFSGVRHDAGVVALGATTRPNPVRKVWARCRRDEPNHHSVARPSDLNGFKGPEIVVIENPMNVESEIRLGQVSVARRDPDNFPGLIAAYPVAEASGGPMEPLPAQSGSGSSVDQTFGRGPAPALSPRSRRREPR